MQALRTFIIARLLTLSSFSGVILFYLLTTPALDAPVAVISAIPHAYWIKVVTAIAVFVGLSWFFLQWVKNTLSAVDTLNAKEIKSIESVAMPTYIGLFVIALELTDNPLHEATAVLSLLLVLWGYFERVFYFNPIWLIFGYRFYEVKSSRNNTFTLITKQSDLKGEKHFINLRRLNNYTFLEVE